MPKLKMLSKVLCLLIVLIFTVTACGRGVEPDPTPTLGGDVTASPDMQQEPKLETEVEGLIHVNQVGYKTGDEKIAVLVGEHDSFQLVAVDQEGETIVLNSEISAGPIHDVSTGDLVYHIDFSQVTEAGEHYISVPGAGRSYTFQIEDNPYGDLRNALLKLMYFQRCGVELEDEHAGPWVHAACHTDHAKVYEDRDIIMDTTGGWHDAGDYGKYTVPVAVTLASMLNAYEMFPTAFEDDINIPESGNDIPDIIDESLYALDWMLRMQDSASGGVYHKVSTNSFPGFIMPENDKGGQYISPISPTATGSFAAIMAHSARLVNDFDADFADKALAAAEKAWLWLEANPDAPGFTNPQGVSTGEYGDGSSSDERIWAAIELYKTTGKDEYHDYVKGKFRSIGVSDLGWVNNSGFAAISYLFMDEDMQASQVYDYLKDQYLDEASKVARRLEYNGYNVAIRDSEYYWGSNMEVMKKGIFMVVANLLEENPAYEQIGMDQLHYLLGRNGLSQSYVTGFGSKSVWFPHHRPSGADNVREPVPGMVAGGPNMNREDNVAKSQIAEGTPSAKCYIDLEDSYSTNEITTYWNSPALFVAAYFSQDQ